MATTYEDGQRKNHIDFLKVVGLLGIILAHVNPPSLLFQIRNFDVVLLVFLSGMLAKESYRRSSNADNHGSLVYYKKRIERLLVPTWVFLTFYFLLLAVLGKSPDIASIVKTYFFQEDGIGYTWIIWIYLLCAFMIPLLLKINIHKKKCIFLLTLIYVGYELVYALKIGIDLRIVHYLFFDMIPYSLLTLYGLNFTTISNKLKKQVSLMCFAVYFAIALILFYCNDEYVLTSVFKYPPRIYYLSYAVWIITWFTVLLEHKDYKLFRSKLIVFISSSSLWIYLWHILAIKISNHIGVTQWLVSYIFIIVFSISVTYIQNRIISELEYRYGKNVFLKFFRG